MQCMLCSRSCFQNKPLQPCIRVLFRIIFWPWLCFLYIFLLVIAQLASNRNQDAFCKFSKTKDIQCTKTCFKSSRLKTSLLRLKYLGINGIDFFNVCLWCSWCKDIVQWDGYRLSARRFMWTLTHLFLSFRLKRAHLPKGCFSLYYLKNKQPWDKESFGARAR